ncbi:MAG: glycosyltransferase family 2 protein [Mariprofundaceae bacterium]|nr:glycosyltransferase family 2 protein [Mariprofundaceae bacterium]
MTPPGIAVVISTYNAPAFLQLVLDGYRKQSDLNFTIYIADDGSGEETKDLVIRYQADFPVPVKHIWHEDSGFRKSKIHNITIRQIDEPYVLLTDGDCVPLPRMVETHRKFAKRGQLISGGRVLLSRTWTQSLCDGTAELHSDASLTEWFSNRLNNNINRILPFLIPSHLGKAGHKLRGIRGCHLSCWLDDLRKINGFDETYQGWGREDSDLVARLFHAGIYRRELRGMPVLHLWHQEEERGQLNKNDRLLQACLENRRVEALKGLKQLQERS